MGRHPIPPTELSQEVWFPGTNTASDDMKTQKPHPKYKNYKRKAKKKIRNFMLFLTLYPHIKKCLCICKLIHVHIYTNACTCRCINFCTLTIYPIFMHMEKEYGQGLKHHQASKS